LSNETNTTDMLGDAGAKLLTGGIVALRTANPAAWAAFKKGLKCVAVGSAALDEITDDDQVKAEEIQKCLTRAEDYGAFRTLEDLLWGLLKHVNG
jgi:hypothetical protein